MSGLRYSASPIGALAKIGRDGQAAAIARCAELAQMAVQLQGLDTLLMPSSTVAALHEAGHAVLYATLDNPPAVVRIWPVGAAHGGGFGGECAFPADAPPVRLHPIEQPHEAIDQACIILAGWLAELTFAGDRLKLGSSLDEITLAGGLIVGAAQALGFDRELLHQACCAVTYRILTGEAATVMVIQRQLVAESRLRGRKLAGLLARLPRFDVSGSVINACQAMKGPLALAETATAVRPADPTATTDTLPESDVAPAKAPWAPFLRG